MFDNFVKTVIILGVPNTRHLLNVVNFKPETWNSYNVLWQELCHHVIEAYGENIPQHVTEYILEGYFGKPI